MGDENERPLAMTAEMDLREMIRLVRELHPELVGRVRVGFDDAMNSALTFSADGVGPVHVPVGWNVTPTEALRVHAANRARHLAYKARAEADAATKRAATLTGIAEAAEARAGELAALAPAKDGAA